MMTELPPEFWEDATTMMTFDPDHGPPAYVTVLKRVNKVILTSLLTFIMVAMGCVVTVDDFRVVVST